MLVLQRKVNESVVIPTPLGPIRITVIDDHVRLGFEAPDAIEIIREEIMGDTPETCASVWGTLPIGGGS